MNKPKPFLTSRGWYAFGLVLAPGLVSLAQTTHPVTPAGSIQSVIDTKAQAGDVILLADGVYHQPVTVTKALTIKAANGGKAILSGAHPGSLVFVSEPATTGLYSVAVAWPVKWAMHQDRNLLDYLTLADLQSFTIVNSKVPNGYPGPKEGFAYANGKLYVRLLNNANPNGQVEISGNHAGVGLAVTANNVTIEGLRIHLWHEAGVNMGSGRQDLTVRQCYFDGCSKGINALDGNLKTYLKVENNEFSGKPIYEIRKSNVSYDMWKALYNTNLAVRFLRVNANGITARNNYVYQVFDGMECKGGSKSTSPVDLESDFSYNLIQNVVDNPIEFDTDERYMNVRLHHNFLLDGYSVLSFAPFQAGKLMVDHNIVYISPQYGLGFGRWLKNCVHEFADPKVSQKNITVVHNTAILGNTSSQSSEMYTPCVEGFQFENSLVENNIIVVKNSQAWAMPGYVFSSKNLVYGSNFLASHVPDALHANPEFAGNTTTTAFILSDRSPAINAGVNKDNLYFHASTGSGTDLGAIEYGEGWYFPAPGPTWATNATMPQRSPIPDNLDLYSPSTPNLLASNQPVDGIALTWSAASDNVGVVGYEVYQDGVKITPAPVTGTSWVVSGLLPNTSYTFTVKARDAAGNVSAVSNSVGVTTGSAANFAGYYQLTAKHSGQVLDVENSSTADGAKVQQWNANSSPAQQWLMEATGNGYYTLKARCSGKALEVSNASLADGANVWQSTTNNGDAQHWKPESVGDGYYQLVSKVSGKLLDVSGISMAEGARVIQSSANGGDNQKWRLVATATVARTTSTQEFSGDGLVVYPNPATDRVVVSYAAPGPGEARIEMVNWFNQVQVRKVVASQTGINRVQVGIGQLSNGMYLLKVTAAGRTTLAKVMLAK